MATNTIITVVNEFDQPLDEGMLQTVMVRVARHIPNARFIDIYTQSRVPLDQPAYKHPGWLEWIIKITYNNSCVITIGAIQRQIGAEYEFHS